MSLPPFIQSLWRDLTRPHPGISDPEDQRRAYTLSIIMLILLGVSPPALITLVGRGDPSSPALAVGTAGILFGVLNYALSRTRHYRLAGFLLFLTISASCLLISIINNDTDVLMFLALGSLIAQLILPFRLATYLVTANVLATIVLSVAVPSWTDDVSAEVYFVIVMSIIIFVTGYIRTRDLERLQEQAEVLVEAEWQLVDLLIESEKVRILSDFIRNISHDFRTPLSIIATKAYLMGKSKSPEEQQRNMASINQQITRLTQLIDGMLVMSRLDSDLEIEFRPVDIAAVLRKIMERLNDTAREKQITLQVNLPDTLPRINASEELLLDGLAKVIENGIVYTPSGGEVVVDVSHTPDQVVIEVCDTGVGISDEDIDLIFDRLYRGDKTRPSTGGVGLGLSIARRVIELHHGQISVASTVNQGSVFRITLPITVEKIERSPLSRN